MADPAPQQPQPEVVVHPLSAVFICLLPWRVFEQPEGFPSTRLVLHTIKQDAVALARLLLDPVGLALEVDQLYAGQGLSLGWMWGGIRDDLERFQVVLDEAARTLCERWNVVLAPLGIGVCFALAAPVIFRWLWGDEDDGLAAWMRVGELGPVGVCLSDLAGWTKEILRLERNEQDR